MDIGICSPNFRPRSKIKRNNILDSHKYSSLDNLFIIVYLVDHFTLNRFDNCASKVLFSYRLGTPIWVSLYNNDVFWVLYFDLSAVDTLSWDKISIQFCDKKSEVDKYDSVEW